MTPLQKLNQTSYCLHLTRHTHQPPLVTSHYSDRGEEPIVSINGIALDVVYDPLSASDEFTINRKCFLVFFDTSEICIHLIFPLLCLPEHTVVELGQT